MLQVQTNPNAIEVTRLLDGAAKTMRSARYCWLATATESGIPHLRPMGRVLNDPGEDAWKVRFLTDGQSHKAGDMRRASEVTILFQHDPDLAFVSLIGKATLHENASETCARWKPAYSVYFPMKRIAGMRFRRGRDRAHGLWIRGVTREPFGLRATVLERDAEGWLLIGG